MHHRRRGGAGGRDAERRRREGEAGRDSQSQGVVWRGLAWERGLPGPWAVGCDGNWGWAAVKRSEIPWDPL